MKKNLLSILILGLTFINIIISGVTLFSVMTTNQKTAKVVSDVANAISIDVNGGSAETESQAVNVPIENIETYAITEKMTIELKPSSDGQPHYAMVKAFFSMDITHKDYKKYGADVATNENILIAIIRETFAEYTLDEARVNQDEIKKQILKKVQEKYSDSDFIFDVSFSDIVFQ